MNSTLEYIKFGLLIYFGVYVVYAIGTALFSKRLMKKIHGRPLQNPNVFSNIPLTIVVPAYNEAVVIRDTLRNLMHQTYPLYEIIVVNDGSSDETMNVLREDFKLIEYVPPPKQVYRLKTSEIRGTYIAQVDLPSNVSRIVVIDKKNGGKADSFNAALNITQSEYVMTVDADTVLISTALAEMMTPIYLDPHVIAVGSQVGVMNNSKINADGSVADIKLPRKWLQGVQALEYMKTFLIYRTGHNSAGATLLISGACGLFRTDLLTRLGGFDTNSVCEDIEMTMRIQNYIRRGGHDLKIDFIVNPVAWTEVPSTLSDLNKQRNRWYRGAAHALWKFKGMVLSPKMGSIGFFSIPMYWLFGYLTPFTQLLLSGLLILELLNLHSFSEFGALISVGIIVASIINALTISMLQYTNSPIKSMSDKGRLFWYGLIEMFLVQFVYMFINLKAAFDAFRGNRSWNKFARIGYNHIKDGSNA
jgi:cellulose synthase/poly-beta-1,6-N-acetylglucosamine synthase-like glycosyltransferase